MAFQFGAPTVIFIALALTVLLLSTVASFIRTWDAFEKRPAEIANSAASEATSFFKSLETLLGTVASGIGNPSELDMQDQVLLSKIVSRNTALLELVFYDANGNETFSVTKATVGSITEKNDRTGSRFLNLVRESNEPILLSPQWSLYNTPYILWLFPVRNEDTGSLSVMQATIDVSILRNIVSAYRATQDIHIFVIDAENTVLVDESATASQTQTLLLSDPLVARFRDGQRDTSVYSRNDMDFVGAWSSIQPSKWGLLVETPTVLYYRSVEREAVLFAFAFALLVTLASIQFILMRRAFLSPLRRMISRIALFSAGNYTTRVEISVQNELAILAKTFNHMADSIEARSSKIVEELQATAKEQETSSKMLIRRDLELARANERLQALDAAKTQFVSVAAHQLRTPLSAIRWAIKMLIDGDIGELNEKQQKMLGKTFESNNRMIRLVNDLLDVDHIDAGKMSYTFTSLDIVASIKNVLQELAPLAVEKNVSLEFCDFGKQKSMVRADPDKIRLVLENIIENALKYTPSGGTVTVCIYDADKDTEIRVTDTGIGITKENHGQLFRKFFRAENAIKLETNGSGLGLFVAKEIVGKHRGRIWFESEEGSGTVFHFTLPRAQYIIEKEASTIYMDIPTGGSKDAPHP